MNRKRLLSFGFIVIGMGMVCFGLWEFDPRLGYISVGLGLLSLGIGVI